LKVSSHVDSFERSFCGFGANVSEVFEMGSVDQTITVDSLAFVKPKFRDLLDILEVLWSRKQDTSE
jgi:hypothetical protein